MLESWLATVVLSGGSLHPQILRGWTGAITSSGSGEIWGRHLGAPVRAFHQCLRVLSITNVISTLSKNVCASWLNFGCDAGELECVFAHLITATTYIVLSSLVYLPHQLASQSLITNNECVIKNVVIIICVNLTLLIEHFSRPSIPQSRLQSMRLD
jgi:hypothetical protein